MDGVVGTDKKVGTGCGQLVSRCKHEIAYALQVPLLEAIHVIGERMSVHGHFRVSVRTKKRRAFRTDGSIAERCAFSGAAYDSYVLAHILGVAIDFGNEGVGLSRPWPNTRASAACIVRARHHEGDHKLGDEIADPLPC
jgi:hypothetical protein